LARNAVNTCILVISSLHLTLNALLVIELRAPVIRIRFNALTLVDTTLIGLLSYTTLNGVKDAVIAA
jgi:hypothetical protein